MKRGVEYWRNQHGYTSFVLSLGVQWDFKDNCGHQRFRHPLKTDFSFREDFPPSFSRNPELCFHSYLQGDFGSVCRRCGFFVPNGEPLPQRGFIFDPVTWIEEVSRFAEDLFLKLKAVGESVPVSAIFFDHGDKMRPKIREAIRLLESSKKIVRIKRRDKQDRLIAREFYTEIPNPKMEAVA